MAKSTKSPRSPNRLLASLRPTDFEVLRPHLKHVELVHEVVLYKTGDTIDRVYDHDDLGYLYASREGLVGCYGGENGLQIGEAARL